MVQSHSDCISDEVGWVLMTVVIDNCVTFFSVHDAIVSLELVVTLLEWWHSERAISLIHQTCISNEHEAHEQVEYCFSVRLPLGPSIGM